jgi:hypothetical protein
MRWITVAWSVAIGICMTLTVIHLFVFTERRSRVANNAETEAVFG